MAKTRKLKHTSRHMRKLRGGENNTMNNSAVYNRILEQLSKRENSANYKNMGEEANQFIQNEKFRERHNKNKTMKVKNMRNLVKKRMNEIKKANLTQKEREEALIKDVKDDEGVLKVIQTKNETLEQEPTEAELALLVAMKIFNQIHIFRASGCPALLSDTKFTVDFPSMGVVDGKDLSNRRKGLELLKDKYKELMEKKAEKQKIEPASFQNKLKATYKMARNTAGRTIGKAVGISKRVSRSEVPLFLDRLIKDGAVSKKVCEWQAYAFRFEMDFGFPKINETINPKTGNPYSEAELIHMAGRAALLGTGLLAYEVVGTAASVAGFVLSAIGKSLYHFFQIIGSLAFGFIA